MGIENSCQPEKATYTYTRSEVNTIIDEIQNSNNMKIADLNSEIYELKQKIKECYNFINIITKD